MQLSELVDAVGPLDVRGDTGVGITAVTYDATQTVPGHCTSASPASAPTATTSREIAVERGAAALIVERFLPVPVPQLGWPGRGRRWHWPPTRCTATPAASWR